MINGTSPIPTPERGLNNLLMSPHDIPLQTFFKAAIFRISLERTQSVERRRQNPQMPLLIIIFFVQTTIAGVLNVILYWVFYCQKGNIKWQKMIFYIYNNFRVLYFHNNPSFDVLIMNWFYYICYISSSTPHFESSPWKL